MEQFLAFGIVGLSTAAVYAVIGSGLVLTYVTTGVFNFAHGAAGMLAAFAYWQLSVGWGWPVPVALVVVLFVLAPLFGLAVERVLMRPVRHLGEAEKLVMTVALLSTAVVAARWIWDPNVARPLPAFFADRPAFHLGPVSLSWHQGLTMVVAVLVAAVLWALLNRTRVGTEMRATVDDRALARLNGANPLRAGRIAWALGTMLAALGGILIAPTVALDASSLSLLIVSAYTAAIFGWLRSLPLTFLGAVVVGCLESFLTGYLPQNPYLPGLRLAAPALLLFLTLLVFPQRRLRGRERRLVRVPVPSARGALVFSGCVVLLGVFLATTMGESELLTYGPLFGLGVIALSYVPLTGFAGQISLCQMSIAGIGAVVWGHLGAHGELWALPAAMLVSAAVGAVIALPALRFSGVYLALGTAAFTVVLDRWIFTMPSFEVFGVTVKFFEGGDIEQPAPALFGFRPDSPAQLTVFCSVLLALVSLAVAWLRRSRFGRRLIALRDSEAAYATLGGSVLVARVAVFALAAGIAGLGGALYGMQHDSVTAENFDLIAGLPLFLVAVIGGLGMTGTGLFSGAGMTGPGVLNHLGSWGHNLSALLAPLAGLGLGHSPEGIVARLRREWAPMARDRLVLALMSLGLAAGWGLRIADVLGGWYLLAWVLVWPHALRYLARARAGNGTADVPLEWRGVRRPWRDTDKEVLARGLAGG